MTSARSAGPEEERAAALGLLEHVSDVEHGRVECSS